MTRGAVSERTSLTRGSRAVPGYPVGDPLEAIARDAPRHVLELARRYRSAGEDGRRRAPRADEPVCTRCGFADTRPPLESWMDRHACWYGRNGGRNGHGH